MPSADLQRPALGKAILELFAQRWPLEVAFYNAKQFLGLEDPQNRTPQAVRRTAPIALYLHTMVILWFAKHGRFDAKAFRETHPWYTQKRTPSFADMLVSLKRASLRESISRYPGQKPPSAKKLQTLSMKGMFLSSTHLPWRRFWFLPLLAPGVWSRCRAPVWASLDRPIYPFVLASDKRPAQRASS